MGKGEGVAVTLAEATASLTIPDSVLAAANATLEPKRMSVSVVDGKRLVLKVRTARPLGCRIIVR